MRIRIIDAFTERPFAGNPAGVCLFDGDAWPDETWMRQVAAEVHASETAFAHPMGGDNEWGLRWFTPAVESDLCGHATLATTHALRSDGRIAGAVRYHTRSGVLIAHPNDDDTITLDFPAAPLTEVPIPEDLVEALGVKPEATYRTGPLRDLLTVLSDEAAVRAVAPDIAAVEALTRRDNIRGVTVTAPATEYDFVSRFFAPGDGIPEDPVTGSAHTAIAPYWAGRLGRDELTGLQASARTGVLRLAVRGDRVHITGSAVTVVDGTLLSEP
jgi:PhzF family phenazine biosynthesis protein